VDAVLGARDADLLGVVPGAAGLKIAVAPADVGDAASVARAKPRSRRVDAGSSSTATAR
jgi:hypothetical protein